MPQTELSKIIGISQGYLSQIISKERTPSWRIAKKLAKAVNTSPLLWLEGSPAEMKAALSNNGGGKTLNQG